MNENDFIDRPDKLAFRYVAAIVYALLIIAISLNPFSNWQMPENSVWEFFTAPLPKFWTKFDLTVNVLAYIPLGLFVCLSSMPRFVPGVAFIVGVVFSSLFSGGMEVMQNFLPNRISSNLDLFCNSLGGLIGSMLAVVYRRQLLEESRFLKLRRNWIQENSGFGLVLVCLWFLAQLQPQAFAFAQGDWVKFIAEILEKVFEEPLPNLWQELNQEQYNTLESIVVACQLTSAGLVFGSLMRSRAPRQLLLATWFCCAIFCKAVVSLQFLEESTAFGWLSQGTLTGVILSAIMLFALSLVPRRIMLRIGLMMLVIGVFSLNILPENPYVNEKLQEWNPGHWLNFNGLCKTLDLCWPILAGIYFSRHIFWHVKHPIPHKN